MKNPARFLRNLWPLAPLGALAFVLWTSQVRRERVEFVTRTAQEGAAVDARTATGWADGKRWLIVPEHNNPTYQWIEETQLMLARHEWRIRRIAYENSPIGRDVQARVGPILDRLAAAHAGTDLIVVSHGGVMACLWAHVTGSWENAHVPPNCGIVLIEHRSGRYRAPEVVFGEPPVREAGG